MACQSQSNIARKDSRQNAQACKSLLRAHRMARAIENQSFGISLQMGSKRFNTILVVREFILRGANDLTTVPHRPEKMSRKPLAVAGFDMVDDHHRFQRTIGNLERDRKSTRLNSLT